MESKKDRHSGPILIKPMFNWEAHDRYVELMNFYIEVLNILEIKVCKLLEEEKVPVMKDWLGQEGLQLIQTFTEEEREIQD